MADKKIILTGDRPTGQLHLGHFVGALRQRVELQNSKEFDKIYIMIADSQAMTDNAKNPQKVQENVLEVLKDYIAIGIDPKKCTIFLQSSVAELTELTFYYCNLVTLARLQRNPTVKTEISQKNMQKSLPVGFLIYPISQAADITAFDATCVPVGEDQMPVIEQCREIVHTFNNTYGQTLVMPSGRVELNKKYRRLKGLDGSSKMSKSLGNTIYLNESSESLKQKVMSMYTDPNHLKVSDPGNVKNNMVFEYLDVFCKEEHFTKYLPEYKNLKKLKNHYERGGLGDVKIKVFLYNVLEELIAPIRQKRASLSGKEDELLKLLSEGTRVAREHAAATVKRVKKAMGLYLV